MKLKIGNFGSKIPNAEVSPKMVNIRLVMITKNHFTNILTVPLLKQAKNMPARRRDGKS